MERLVPIIFKTLMLSMLFMFLLDTSLLLVEVVSIHSRVSNLSNMMQLEVARNNYMPTEIANTFQDALNTIAENSTIIDNNGIVTNMKSTLDGRTELTADYAGNYGDTVDLLVRVNMHPTYVYYNPNRTGANSSWLLTSVGEITLDYEYAVPCLRYLK